MTTKKAYKANDIVLTCVRKTKKGPVKFDVSANYFNAVNFADVEVSGEDYYVAKAVKAGAKKAKA